MYDFSIILPTYNEKNNIISLINEIIDLYSNEKEKFEILVIDDDSPDKTFNIVKSTYKKFSYVKCYKRVKNKGLGNSIGFGLKKALGKHLIVMDTDLTHDPLLIKSLIYINKVYHLVSCSRYCCGGSMENKKHLLGSYIYNLILRIILKTQIQDNLGGYFSIRKEVLKSLPLDKIFYGYGEYFFRLLHFAQKKGYSIVEIPAFYKNRIDGTSKSKFFSMFFSYFLSAIKLRFRKINQ